MTKDREPLAEAIDNVRHRGLPRLRHEVCSVCTDEAEFLRVELRRLGYELKLERK